MHEIDPDETAANETMGRRDATAPDQSMDPEGLNTPGRVAPDETSAIPPDTRPSQASDQSAAPAPDVMGGRGDMAPDVMGAPIPEPDETLGDRREGDRR